MELSTVVLGLGLVVHCFMDEVKDNFGAIITGYESLAIFVATCLVTASYAIITSYRCLLHHYSFATCVVVIVKKQSTILTFISKIEEFLSDFTCTAEAENAFFFFNVMVKPN